MLVLAMILAATSVWLEIKLVGKYSLLRKLSGKYVLVGIAISLALSWALGIMFGASGIIIMLAGLVSTAVSEPIRRNYNRSKEMEQKLETARYWKNETSETYKYVLVALKWIGVVLLSPLWVPVWLHAQNKKRNLQHV